MRRSLAGSGFLALLLSAALGRASYVALAAPQANLVLTVNSEADAPATGLLNNGICQTAIPNQCTLRAAIMKANNWHGSSVTILLPGLPSGHKYLLTDGPLGSDDDSSGDLNLYPAAGRPSLTIQGSDPFNTIIDASGLSPADRGLSIAAGVTATISFVTIQGGQSGHGAGIDNNGSLTLIASNLFLNRAVAAGPDIGQGGGLYNTGSVTLVDDFIANNSAQGETGGIHNNAGVVTLINSIVSGNTSDGIAGGIWNDRGTLTLNRTEINDNDGMFGGGIRNVMGAMTATNSSLVYNFTTAGGGGALANFCGSAVVVNSTISSNDATTNGAGVDNEDTGSSCGTLLKLRSATIAMNVAATGGSGQGGGIYDAGNSTVDLQDTILSNNQLGAGAFNPGDCDSPGTLSSSGYNLISSLAGCHVGGATGDIYNQFALLRPLALNGGITLNHALNPGSPAVDAGFPGGCFDAVGIGLTTDQRDAPRIAFGGHSFTCDMGAFELQQTLDLPLLVR